MDTKLVFESIHSLLLYIHISLVLAYFISHIKNDSQFIKILFMIDFYSLNKDEKNISSYDLVFNNIKSPSDTARTLLFFPYFVNKSCKISFVPL
jgi:hypothetical protein